MGGIATPDSGMGARVRCRMCHSSFVQRPQCMPACEHVSALDKQEGVPPETLLVFHTLHSPHRVTDPRAWEADPFMPQHVAQINAAGREVPRPAPDSAWFLQL